MIGLTRKQLEVRDFIASYISEHGYSPTYREMAAAIGVVYSRIAEIIEALEERRAIRRLKNRARAIEILSVPAVRPTDIRQLGWADITIPVFGYRFMVPA